MKLLLVTVALLVAECYAVSLFKRGSDSEDADELFECAKELCKVCKMYGNNIVCRCSIHACYLDTSRGE